MKKILIINTLIWSIIFSSCIREKKESVDENFSLFLKTFSQDSIFQMQRVKFPLRIKEWVDPEIGIVEKSISKAKYTILDFTYPEDALTKAYDRYTQKINLNGNKCTIEIRGVDNGIYTDFFFEKINGKWILISWSEQST